MSASIITADGTSTTHRLLTDPRPGVLSTAWGATPPRRSRAACGCASTSASASRPLKPSAARPTPPAPRGRHHPSRDLHTLARRGARHRRLGRRQRKHLYQPLLRAELRLGLRRGSRLHRHGARHRARRRTHHRLRLRRQRPEGALRLWGDSLPWDVERSGGVIADEGRTAKGPIMLKLISWNVNGIRAAEKKGFLDWLAASGSIGWPRAAATSSLCRRPRRTPTNSRRSCMSLPAMSPIGIGRRRRATAAWRPSRVGRRRHPSAAWATHASITKGAP